MAKPFSFEKTGDLGQLFLKYHALTPAVAGQPPSQRQWNAFQKRQGSVWGTLKREAGHNRGLRECVWNITGIPI